jgi:tRNA(Ile)-lysidine synthase
VRYTIRPPPLRGFVARVAETVARRALARPGARVLAALSAGPDSTALVSALAALRDAGRIGAVHALHVDHGLREGGGDDAACAAEACARLGVPFRSVRVRVETARGNLQAAARRARYGALRDEAARLGADRIATGHTRDDQAETFLLRALRGAGARGLSSIPPRRGAIVRPLIDVGRAEVLAHLQAEGLRWREDPTNRSARFARNRLRLELVPVLREIAPGWARALARAADLLRDDERALAARARRLIDGPVLAVAALRGEPRAVRRRLLRALWTEGSAGAAPLPAERVEAVLALCGRRGPGRLALPNGLEARVAYGRVTIGPAPSAPPAMAPVAVPGPGTYRVGALDCRVAVDGDGDVAWPLVLRRRRPGDRFRPERGRGGKKLKAWLIDRKIPRERRDELLVLADGAGNVLALPELGVRAASVGGLHVTVGPTAS